MTQPNRHLKIHRPTGLYVKENVIDQPQRSVLAANQRNYVLLLFLLPHFMEKTVFPVPA